MAYNTRVPDDRVRAPPAGDHKPATKAKTLAEVLYGPGTVNAGPPDEPPAKPSTYVSPQEKQFGELARLMYGPGTVDAGPPEKP